MISHQQIKYITSLHQKKYRNEHKSYIIEGNKIVEEAIFQIPDKIEMVCYTSKSEKMARLLNKLKDVKFLEVSADEFSKISAQVSPQEILAVVKQSEYILSPGTITSDITLALDSVRDPGNFGTIIRLADWFGIRQIICSEDTVDCYNPKVVQSTMGAIFRVEVIYTDLGMWLLDVKQNNSAQIYGSTMDGQNLYSFELRKPAILIFGNEAKGISENITKLAHANLCIPNYSSLLDKTESLNVSIATAIVCAEFRRKMS